MVKRSGEMRGLPIMEADRFDSVGDDCEEFVPLVSHCPKGQVQVYQTG